MLDKLQKIFPTPLLIGVIWANVLFMVVSTIVKIVEKYGIN